MSVNLEASALYAYHVDFCRDEPEFYPARVLLGTASMALLDIYRADVRFNFERPVSPERLPGVNSPGLTEKVTAEHRIRGWSFNVQLLENGQMRYVDNFPNAMLSTLQFSVPSCGTAATGLTCKRLLLEDHDVPRIPLPSLYEQNLRFTSLEVGVDRRRFSNGNRTATLALQFIKQLQKPGQARKGGGSIICDVLEGQSET